MMKEIEYKSKNNDGNFGNLIEDSKNEIEVIKNIVKNIFQKGVNMVDFIPGLAGVPAAHSSISDIDGENGILEQRN